MLIYVTPMIKAEIDCKLESLCLAAGMIDKEMKEFCMAPRNHRTSRLYFLKIHKNPMGIRPIVSSCNSITENISEFVHIWLQPLMRDLPSFIKDTTEFIQLIENTPLPDKCILASTDVSSLYTNIPHHEGKQAAMKALNSVENPDPGNHLLRSLVS